MSMITEEFGVIPPDIQTQMLIAPVMGEMIATQAFAIGEQFIVNSTLYKATKAIAIGDTISVGTGANDNCILSDTIVQQLKAIPKEFTTTVSDVFSSYTNVDATAIVANGDIIELRVFTKSITTNSWNTVGTLKEEYRPKYDMYISAIANDLSVNAMCIIGSNGTVRFLSTAPSSVSKSFYVTATYFKNF